MLPKRLKRYCGEDVSLIENYARANSDDSQVYECHHKDEIDLGMSYKELKSAGLYYNVSADRLILLTHKEHMELHGGNIGSKNGMYGVTGKSHHCYGRCQEKHPLFKDIPMDDVLYRITILKQSMRSVGKLYGVSTQTISRRLSRLTSSV